MHDVVVIGAGITGLTAARELAAQGHDVIVLERAARVGGKAISERAGGYLVEHGPSTINAASTETEALTQSLGLASDRLDLGPNVRKRYLLDGTRLSGISVHPLGFVLSSYLPVTARLSLLAEALRPARRHMSEETVSEFASRRFGASFADKVMDPMIGGIFMGDARQLSVEAVFPKLTDFERDHGSVIRGMLRARKAGDPGRRLYSWTNGVASLPQALAAQLGATIHTGIAVRRIRRLADGFAAETSNGDVRAKSVLLSVQPHVVADLIEHLDPEGAAAAADIPAPPAAVVFAGYQRRHVGHPLDGLGYLATKDSGAISGVQFCSTMFAGRAPEDHVALAAYVGGARRQDLAAAPSRDLAEEVHRELARVLDIRARPEFTQVRHWPLGLPQYLIGHAGRRETLESTDARCPGLFLAGNYLRGVSVGHCVASGHGAAVRLANRLTRVDLRNPGRRRGQVTTAGAAP